MIQDEKKKKKKESFVGISRSQIVVGDEEGFSVEVMLMLSPEGVTAWPQSIYHTL